MSLIFDVVEAMVETTAESFGEKVRTHTEPCENRISLMCLATIKTMRVYMHCAHIIVKGDMVCMGHYCPIYFFHANFEQDFMHLLKRYLTGWIVCLNGGEVLPDDDEDGL